MQERFKEIDLDDYRAKDKRAEADEAGEDFVMEGEVKEKISKEQDVKEMRADDAEDKAENVRVNEEVVEETRVKENERVELDEKVEEIVNDASNGSNHRLLDSITGLRFALICQTP
jgi:hypothetical protein